MAGFLTSYPWNKDPLYKSVATQRHDEIIVAGSDEDESPLTKAERRRKRELIGQRYLRGYMPLIQSAQLVGPFERSSGWTNPWSDHRSKTATKPAQAAKRNRRVAVTGASKSDTLRNGLPSNTYRRLPIQECDGDDEYDNDEMLSHLPSTADGTTDTKFLHSDHRTSKAQQDVFDAFCRQKAADDNLMGSNSVSGQGVKRKSAGNESWLKGAHIIKRHRQETSQHSSPTPAAGARHRQQGRAEKNLFRATTPAQSRRQSPKANGTVGENLANDSPFVGRHSGASSFTPLRSSGQPTPPTESPQKDKQRRPIILPGKGKDSTGYLVDAERGHSSLRGHDGNSSPIGRGFSSVRSAELPMGILDDNYEVQPPAMSLSVPPGSFKYRKTKYISTADKQNSTTMHELNMSNLSKLPTEAPIARTLSPENLGWGNILQKRMVTFSDVDSPGITDLTRERHNKRRENHSRQTPVLAGSFLDTEASGPTMTRGEEIETGQDEDGVLEEEEEEEEGHLEGDDNFEGLLDGNETLIKDGDFDDGTDNASELAMEAVQSQLLSEANEYALEHPTPSITPVSVRQTSPSSLKLSEVQSDDAYGSDTASEDINSSDHDAILPRISPQNSLLRSSHVEDESSTLVEPQIGLLLDVDDISQSSQEIADMILTSAVLKQQEPINQYGEPENVQDDASTQSDDQTAMEDDVNKKEEGRQQSPWHVPESVGIKSVFSDVANPGVGSQDYDQPSQDDGLYIFAAEQQQSPWAAASLSSKLSNPSDVESRTRQEGTVEAEQVTADIPIVDDLFLSNAERLGSPPSYDPAPLLLDPFMSTQVLVEEATANPWARSDKKRKSGIKKRVSWVPLPEDDSNCDHTAKSPRSSQRMASPPPPQESLALAELDNTFHQLLKIGRKPGTAPAFSTPSLVLSKKGAKGDTARAAFHQLSGVTSAHNSPAIDAMAEAFIAADRHSSHDICDSGSQGDQENIHWKTQRASSSEWRRKRNASSAEVADLQGISQASFSVTPKGAITALCSAEFDAMDDDEVLGAVINDMGSFLEGWDIDTELKKADKSSNGNE